MAAEQDPHARYTYTLRRGNLIFKDVTEDGSGSRRERRGGSRPPGCGEQDAEGEDGEEGAVRWSVPDGFTDTVAPEPSIHYSM